MSFWIVRRIWKILSSSEVFAIPPDCFLTQLYSHILYNFSIFSLIESKCLTYCYSILRFVEFFVCRTLQTLIFVTKVISKKLVETIIQLNVNYQQKFVKCDFLLNITIFPDTFKECLKTKIEQTLPLWFYHGHTLISGPNSVCATLCWHFRVIKINCHRIRIYSNVFMFGHYIFSSNG